MNDHPVFSFCTNPRFYLRPWLETEVTPMTIPAISPNIIGRAIYVCGVYTNSPCVTNFAMIQSIKGHNTAHPTATAIPNIHAVFHPLFFILNLFPLPSVYIIYDSFRGFRNSFERHPFYFRGFLKKD